MEEKNNIIGLQLESWFQKIISTTWRISVPAIGRAEKQEINTIDPSEIDKEFEELLNNINLNEDNKRLLRQYPYVRKEHMLVMQHQLNKNKFDTPELYISCLKNNSKSDTLNFSILFDCIKSLRVALTNKSISWLHEFGTEGLQTVLSILELTMKCNEDDGKNKLQEECLKCIFKYINNIEGLEEFSQQDSGHFLVASCIDYRKPSVMISALEILALLSFIDGNINNNSKILVALRKLGEMTKRERFQPIIEGISLTSNNQLWSSCLQFINTLLSHTHDFQFRIHLRSEFIRNGLGDKLDILKNQSTALVNKQFSIFESLKDKDTNELQSRFDNLRIEINDINNCFKILKNVTSGTQVEPYFLSILQHLIFIHGNVYTRTAYFKLIEECVTQIVLHRSSMVHNFSKKPIDLDLQPLINDLIDQIAENGGQKQLTEDKASTAKDSTVVSKGEQSIGLLSDDKLKQPSLEVHPNLTIDASPPSIKDFVEQFVLDKIRLNTNSNLELQPLTDNIEEKKQENENGVIIIKDEILIQSVNEEGHSADPASDEKLNQSCLDEAIQTTRAAPPTLRVGASPPSIKDFVAQFVLDKIRLNSDSNTELERLVNDIEVKHQAKEDNRIIIQDETHIQSLNKEGHSGDTSHGENVDQLCSDEAIQTTRTLPSNVGASPASIKHSAGEFVLHKIKLNQLRVNEVTPSASKTKESLSSIPKTDEFGSFLRSDTL